METPVKVSDVPLYLRKNDEGKYEPITTDVPMTATEVLQRQSPPIAVLYTTRQYPCGCAAEGSGDIPAYCPNHESGPDYSDSPEQMASREESILQEAHRLTHGPRQADYGHPLDDYQRTAAIATALLSHKLKDDEHISAEEMALLMVGVKLSRQVNHPKRDNMVDAAGYAWVAQECLDERARRTGPQISTTETK